MTEIKFTGNIRSAKITKSGGVQIVYTNYTTVDDNVANRSYRITDERAPQKQLTTALRKLLVHGVLLGGFVPKELQIDAKYVKTGKIVDDPIFKDFAINGFTIKGDEDGESVTLHMIKKMHEEFTGKVELPSVNLYNELEYKYSGNLSDDLQSVLNELYVYIQTGDEHLNQLSIDFNHPVEQESDL